MAEKSVEKSHVSSVTDDLLNESEQVRVRFEKLKKIESRGENPYKNGLKPTDYSIDLRQQHGEKTKEELEGARVRASVAGRMMAIRDFGKAAFVQIRDGRGGFQLYVQKQSLGDADFERFRELDIGDVVYADGYLFKTKTGELSLHAEKVSLLTKSLRPLPEKYHGIVDVEARYRHRYVDLIMTEKSRETFVKRSKIVDTVRAFFNEKGFMEVETPMMHPVAGGASARPFVTHHNTLDMKLFLRIAPELYLKRLLVGGFDRVYEINRNFRNEGISIKHNPEFTMLEFYQAYATFEDLIPLTEELFRRVGRETCGSETLTYQGTEIRLKGPWERITVEEAIVKYSGFKDRSKIRDRASLLAYGEKHGIHMNSKLPTGHLIMAIFDAEVESKLVQPTFVTHYPLDVSPLSRKNEKDPFLVDRFELYIYGREMANAFSELNDPIDQKARFIAQLEEKAAGNDEATDMDEDYVNALEYGMPPAAGQGIGIDRMVMLFTDSASIRDVILFPQLRKH